MSVAIATPFTIALGLQAPWEVENVEINTIKCRIDFEMAYLTAFMWLLWTLR